MTAAGDLSVTLLAAGPSVSSQLFGSALIGLREGLETGIVVTILVAFLVKGDHRDALKWVWLGVTAAIAMTVGVFLVIQFGENTISGLAAEAIAGVASVVAVAIVTTMVLWMKKASATISGELRGGMSRALETGGLAVAALAFLAVGREGVETALFMVGYVMWLGNNLSALSPATVMESTGGGTRTLTTGTARTGYLAPRCAACCTTVTAAVSTPAINTCIYWSCMGCSRA